MCLVGMPGPSLDAALTATGPKEQVIGIEAISASRVSCPHIVFTQHSMCYRALMTALSKAHERGA